MAANEKQISQNRRRLFKALSAAPVVATLTPGSALANQSAFQCLSKIIPPVNFHPTDPGCNTGETCYVYQPVEYWDTSSGTPPAGGGKPFNQWPPAVQALANQAIYQTSTGDFFILDVTDGSLGGTSIDATLLDVDASNVMRLVGPPDQNGNMEVFLENIGTTSGRGLVLVQPLDANGAPTSASSTSMPPTQISIDGAVPEVQPVGDLQGITASCLTSIMPGASGFSVARG